MEIRMSIVMDKTKYPHKNYRFENGVMKYVDGYHTIPFGHIKPNGLNFRYSVSNKNSRLYRMLEYLYSNIDNYVTKTDILRDVFGKVGVSRGWGTYVFTLSSQCGFIRSFRKGNKVYYSITEKGRLVIGK